MEFKLIFILVLISCVYIDAQVISSLAKSSQIRKIKAPCGCQGPQNEVPACRCGTPITEPTYNYGGRAPLTCGCGKPTYFDSILEAPLCGCGFEFPASLFSFETLYGCLAPEVCSCRKPAVKLSNSCQKPCGCQANPCRCQANPCGCQATPCACQAKPCGCQTSAVIPVNIFDFLTALEVPSGCQNAIQLNYEYIAPVVECQSRVPTPKCGCQLPKIEVQSCGYGNPVALSTYPYEYLIPVMDLPLAGFQMDVPNYSCQCQPNYYSVDMPKCGCQIPIEMPKLCGCQSSPCGCQSSPCGCQSSPCGCQSSPCGCQSSPCGCQSVPCGCQSSPCGCQSSRCGCQSVPCGCQSTPCGCVCGCGCGKYLRQVTLQPPFL